eukprot:GHVR01180037.1.p1 GENE.GHVR01180037.1~~GHVR01180037.1.p1  ORF type:complete len:115 (+),score=28.46 GHVR01180037.1:17-361(+)
MLTGELILNTCFIVGIIYVLVSLWKKCMVSRKCVDISSDTPLHVSVCLNGTVIDEIKDNNVMMCEGQINSLKSLNNYFNVITITMVCVCMHMCVCMCVYVCVCHFCTVICDLFF